MASTSIIAGARTQTVLAFGNEFISNGFIDNKHTVSGEKIREYLSQNKTSLAVFARNYLLNSDKWRKLPFVHGNDDTGYWFNKDEFNKLKTNNYRMMIIIVIVILALIVIGLFVGLWGH